MNNKEKYHELCFSEESIPIFSQDWWLDVVCGSENWDVCIVEKGGEILATMPYYFKKKYGLVFIEQPPLTQTLGPWIRSTNGKYSKILSKQKQLFEELIKQLPNYSYFHQNFYYKINNWLPFYWNGFNQTSRVTYRIENAGSIEKVWEGLQSNIRTDIKKAQRNNVMLKENPIIDEFIVLNEKVFLRQNKSLPYSKELIKNIYKACVFRNCGKLFLAEDETGQNHAAVYIIWDKENTYYIMGGGDPELRNSGATSFCMWEAIKFSLDKTKSFDFEGSMLEQVEKFFRAFGAIQMPYHSITKSNSKIIDFTLMIKNWIKK